MRNLWLSSPGQGISKFNCVSDIREELRDLQPGAIQAKMEDVTPYFY